MSLKLTIVHGRPAGKSLSFPPGEFFIGRGSECHVRPDSEWVSRQHCLLRVAADGAAYLRDLGSRNGTLINGVLIHREQQLCAGDQVQFGPLVFEVQYDAVATEATVDPLFQAAPRDGGTAEFPAYKGG